MNFRITALSALTLAAALAGCKSYRREPLDFAATDRAWAARDLAAGGVVAYAARIAAGRQVAAVYDPSDGLSLAEAEIVALFYNPQLRLARLRANVTSAGAAEAGRWEDPGLGVDAERILASVAEPWVLAGTVSLTIPVSGRLAAEKAQAAADADAAGMRVLVEEQTALAELRGEWLAWSAARERLDLTRSLLTDLREFAGASEKLRQAGELESTDARRFEMARAAQESRLAAIDADVRDRELGLRSRLGLKPDAPVVLLPTLTVEAGPDSDADPAAPERLNPRLRLARAEHEVSERALRLEVRRQYPDVGLSGGYGTDEGDERVLLGGSLPLPLWNANRRGIAEATAARDAARAAAEGEYEALVSLLARARTRADAAKRRLEFVQRELAPLGEKQLADLRRLARLGDFNSVLLLDAATAAHETKLELVEARLEASRANNQLNSLAEGARPEVRP
jgi:outer membrane protein TolC